jgi:uncharacterized protein (TIGR02246 family)
VTAVPDPASECEAIRNLLARYCLLLDHDDVEACVALFTEDGTFDVYGRTFAGRDGLRRMMTGAPGGLHLGGNPVIELVDANQARTQQNLLFVDRTTGASRSAVYDDVLVRTDDGWRFAARRCRFIVSDGLSERPPE